MEKLHLKKVNEYLWEIPQSFRSDCRVPVRVYASEKMLDDIFSERDHERRDKVLEIVDKLVKRDGQVIMTAADEHLMPGGKDWVKIQL